MPTIDLADFNLAELKGLQFDIDDEIRLRRRDEVARARADILAIAAAIGVSVDDLLSNRPGKPKPA